MPTKTQEAIIAALHQTEEYFFTAISAQHQHFSDEGASGSIKASAYITGIESAGFNVLYVKEDTKQLTTFVARGIEFLQNSNLPYSVMVRSALIDAIKAQLDAQKLTPVYSTLAMSLDMTRYAPQKTDERRAPHATITIQRTDANLAGWAWPLESAFSITPSADANSEPANKTKPRVIDQYRKQHQAALDAQKQLLHFSLYCNALKDKQAVCSLTLSLHNKIARLDDVGTVVEEQGKGYASALIEHALVYAKTQGVTHCFLEASSDGASLYKRIGFMPLFEYTSFEQIGMAD